MVDVDFLVVEYDKARPKALIEYKHENANVDFTNLTCLGMAPQSYEALNKMATSAEIPFFVVRYKDTFSSWDITPRNKIAGQWCKQYLKTTKNLIEEEYVKFLYNIRWRELPLDIIDKLKPIQEVPLSE